jgi:hypothetical protein
MAAIVHHGGAGTTGAALRAGKPSIVTPFIVDQFAWARLLAARGLPGVAATPRHDRGRACRCDQNGARRRRHARARRGDRRNRARRERTRTCGRRNRAHWAAIADCTRMPWHEGDSDVGPAKLSGSRGSYSLQVAAPMAQTRTSGFALKEAEAGRSRRTRRQTNACSTRPRRLAL